MIPAKCCQYIWTFTHPHGQAGALCKPTATIIRSVRSPAARRSAAWIALCAEPYDAVRYYLEMAAPAYARARA